MGRSCARFSGSGQSSVCYDCFVDSHLTGVVTDWWTVVIGSLCTMQVMLISSCMPFVQLRQKGRVMSVGDVVTRGQKVWAKVLSFTGQKTSLSMKVLLSVNFRLSCLVLSASVVAVATTVHASASYYLVISAGDLCPLVTGNLNLCC